MDGVEDHKGFAALNPQFWGLEPPLTIATLKFQLNSPDCSE